MSTFADFNNNNRTSQKYGDLELLRWAVRRANTLRAGTKRSIQKRQTTFPRTKTSKEKPSSGMRTSGELERARRSFSGGQRYQTACEEGARDVRDGVAAAALELTILLVLRALGVLCVLRLRNVGLSVDKRLLSENGS